VVGWQVPSLSAANFLQFMITGRTEGVTRIAFDNIRTIPASEAQLGVLSTQREGEQLLVGPPAVDGTRRENEAALREAEPMLKTAEAALAALQTRRKTPMTGDCW
jgi:hypothetical protein